MTSHPLPLVRAAAPGRVNLIGEHLDYNGGRCLPIALDRRTVATVAASPDGRHHLHSGELAWHGAVGERADGWASYVVGVLEALGVRDPLAVTIRSDVPVGSGLSSSAALECAVAVAVNACLALGRSDEELVAACIAAETSYVGAPTGGLDQTTALFGRPGHALLLDFADGSRTPVPWRPEPAGLRLLVIDTKVAHRLALGALRGAPAGALAGASSGDGGYAARRAECEAAARTLGLDRLADASPDDLARLTGNELRRARHVVTEQARVAEFVDALVEDDWATVGHLMTASHASLRDDFDVSCAELDAAVEAARDAGAAGARMTGGGFGGSAIALVPVGRADAVEAAVRERFAEDGYESPAVFPVEAAGAAEVVQIS
ncbi:galactokinase [Marmoricola sp. RAF53]|uniref:galactokinase n=1 Tax=Marmoricola sp. RAF53 TaxID=3233059 RepID=UPI003F94BA18